MLSAKPWTLETLVRLILGIVFCIGCLMIAGGAWQGFTGKKLDDASPMVLFVGSLLQDGSLLLVVAWLVWSKRVSWSEAFGLRNRPGRAVLLGLLAGLLFFPVGMYLQVLCKQVLDALKVGTPEQQAVEMLRKAESGWVKVYLSAFAALIAPVAEEAVFRGVLYPAVKQNGFPRTALWGTSLLFAVIHHNLAAFVPLTLLALMLAGLYEMTDNLLANITAHGTFNAANVVLLFILERASHP